MLDSCFIMDYKLENKKTYDLYAEKFEEKFGSHFQQYVKEEADIFRSKLSGKEIVDIGSGPGNHAQYFHDKGFQVLCVDFSGPMLKLCREKGLKTKQMDIEDWKLPENSADGIWAYACLLHIPKNKINQVIENCRKTLKPSGILGVVVKEGIGLKVETDEKYPGTRRLFIYFTEEEIKKLFEKQFEIIHSSKTVKNNHVFLNYLLRLKS